MLNKEKARPLYRQLEDTLSDLIADGGLSKDGPLPSERELCRRYDVSHMTVRLALNELERRQLVVRVPGRGTFIAERPAPASPAPVAPMRPLALILEYNTASEFNMRLMAGIKKELNYFGNDLLLFAAAEDRYFELAQSGSLSGVIIADPHFHDLRLRQLKKLGVPLVVLGSPDQRNVASVDSDNVAVGAQLTRHLYECGFRKIGFLGYNRNFTVTRDRLAGYKEALHAAGLACPRNRILFGEYTERSGRINARRIFEAGADAVVCGDDFLAICVTDQLIEDGIAVGSEFGVCGCNNLQLARLHSPAITSVELMPEELGRQLVVRLRDLPSRGPTPEPTLVPFRLIARHSTMGKPVECALVSDAG